MSRNNLAVAYRGVGRAGEAIPLLERTLADRVRVLGESHPDTLNSRNNLAVAYRAVGRTGEAIPLYEVSLAGFERVLGAEHPTTVIARENLAQARREVEGQGESPVGLQIGVQRSSPPPDSWLGLALTPEGCGRTDDNAGVSQ
jgi:hypothetical protein